MSRRINYSATDRLGADPVPLSATRAIGIALALFVPSGVALGAQQLFFETPQGRIVVEIDDDDVEARFKNGRLELYDKDGKLACTLEPSQRNKDVAPGNYSIKVSGKNALNLDTEKFEMKRGNKVTVRVQLDRAFVKAKKLGYASILASPDHVWSEPINLGDAINAGKRNLSPALTTDERIIVYQREQKLWIGRRERSSNAFEKAAPLPDAINQGGADCPTISGDGLLLAFSSTRPGGTGEDIWMSTRKSVDDPFGDPVRLPEPVNTPTFERCPVLSSDGLTLLVTTYSTPPTIVQLSSPSRDKPFQNRLVMPAPINSNVYSIANWISPDGRVIMTTKMAGGQHETGYHVRATNQAAFGPMLKFGEKIDPWSPGRVWLSADGQRLYFHARGLPGSRGDIDLWMSQRETKKE